MRDPIKRFERGFAKWRTFSVPRSSPTNTNTERASSFAWNVRHENSHASFAKFARMFPQRSKKFSPPDAIGETPRHVAHAPIGQSLILRVYRKDLTYVIYRCIILSQWHTSTRTARVKTICTHFPTSKFSKYPIRMLPKKCHAAGTGNRASQDACPMASRSDRSRRRRRLETTYTTSTKTKGHAPVSYFEISQNEKSYFERRTALGVASPVRYTV